MKKKAVRELRAVERFAIRLPVSLDWQGGCRAEGFTKNISTRGMFVAASNGPTEGRVLHFEIDMMLDDSTPLMQVEGEARVVRVERSQRRTVFIGFAVVNLWFKLRPPPEGTARPPAKKAQPGRLSIARSGVSPFPKWSRWTEN